MKDVWVGSYSAPGNVDRTAKTYIHRAVKLSIPMMKVRNEPASIQQDGQNVQVALFSFPRQLIESVAGTSLIRERPDI